MVRIVIEWTNQYKSIFDVKYVIASAIETLLTCHDINTCNHPQKGAKNER